MGATALYTRPGDAQALKACIAAAFSGSQLCVIGDQEVPASPFGARGIAAVVDGGTLTEPNAIAWILAGPELKPPQRAAEIAQWLEWEAAVLRPAVLSCAPDPALEQLAAALGGAAAAGGPYLFGAAPTLADVALYCTLLPLTQQQQQLPPAVAALAAALAATPQAAAGATAAAAGADDADNAASLAVFRADAAAFAARQPRLPVRGARNVLITSALPYVNNVPHLGNIIGCVLSADCYARYARSRGYNAIFVCGTDEYGTATETKALEEGLPCAALCDKYHAVHASIYEWFGIAFDKFGRTPTRAQTEICQAMFRDLHAEGCLSEQSMEQLYSEAAQKFLADRFVTGTCPKCGYEDARGDQCDACGALMNPTELLRPKCKLTGTTPVVRSTRHVFLDLPALTPRLQAYIDNTSRLGGWSANCVTTTAAWMRDGLKPRCITRDLKWGIPVPLAGYEDKVFYVWFDAPIGYISITAGYTPRWREWWQAPDDVELVQFMGKDNVPFHTVIFPATLLGSGRRWTMMKSISVTEYLNYEGGKFSKSRGTGVFGSDARDTGIPPEVWRFYLLVNRPEASDTDFKWADLQARTNNELLKNLGNFVNRALVFVSKFFDGKVPAPGDAASGSDAEKASAAAVAGLGAALSSKVNEYVAAMEAVKLREGLRLAMAVSAEANKFITDTEPFRLVKTDATAAGTLVAAGVGCVRLLAALMEPFTPTLSAKMLEQLSLPADAAKLSDALIAGAADPSTLVRAGHVIGTPAPLVSAIPDERIAELRARFSGDQAADQAAAAAAAVGGGGGGGAKAAGGKGTAGGKGGGKAAAAAGPAEAADAPVDVARLDIRVGVITRAWRHPDADRRA